jgi:hypothetical protein
LLHDFEYEYVFSIKALGVLIQFKRKQRFAIRLVGDDNVSIRTVYMSSYPKITVQQE